MGCLWAQIEFAHPIRLTGLILLPLILYFAWQSGAGGSAVRRIASAVCRCLLVAALVLACAGISQRGPSTQRMLILATDVSRSVQGAGQEAAAKYIAEVFARRGEHHVAVLPFADRPGAVRFEPGLEAAGLDPLASDPVAAVRLAAACVPDEFLPEIVLLTDGWATRGDLREAALETALPVHVVPLPTLAETDSCLQDVVAKPQRFSPRLPVEVVIEAHRAGEAQIEFYRDETRLERQFAVLERGTNRVPFSLPWDGYQAAVLEARLSGSDAVAENNRRRTWVPAGGRPRVLLAAGEAAAAEPFEERLAAQGCLVERTGPAQLEQALGRPSAADLVILTDVAPKDLPAGVTQALQRYVQDAGGGLIVAGGEGTFGEAAFRGTDLERLLPIRAAETQEARPSVLAMVLVIDRSGSMEEERRMDLAKEAARQSVRLLAPYDKAGVMAFSDAPLWIAEIAPCEDIANLIRRIDTLRPGGQTNMYQAVERAFLALRQTVADHRYMILLTDGIPAPGDYREIARRMADAGVTLSTVSISAGAEQDLLQEMARIAGGRHHHCDNPADVPKILVQETKAATGQEAVQSVRVSAYRDLPGLDLRGAPPLAGYALANTKPEAEQLLLAAGRDPLLAWWPQGAGIAVALTSDTGHRWTRPWLSWPGYGAFWSRLVRHAARPPQEDALHLAVACQSDQAVATLQVPAADDRQLQVGQAELRVRRPDGTQTVLAADQQSPTRYAASFPAEALGEYRVQAELRQDDGRTLAAEAVLFRDYLAELQSARTNESLLRAVAEATGGRYHPQPTDLLAPDGRSLTRHTPLWRHFALAAVLLLVVDLALRRVRLA